MSDCLILTGAPGSGKTTVARLLARRRPRSAHVEADPFFHFIVNGYVKPWLAGSEAQNELLTGIVARAARDYAAAGYATILDGIFLPGWYLPLARELLTAEGAAVGYVVLRPPLETVLERAHQRGEDGFSAAEPITKIWRQLADLGELEAHAIDNSELTPEQTADLVEAGIAAGKLLLP